MLDALVKSIIGEDFSLHLPNIRAMLLPSEGYALVEGDFERADAQVAAWDAEASELKELLRHAHDIHSENAQMLYGDVYHGGKFVRVRDIEPRTMHVNGMSYRDNAKRWVHATNFHGGANTVASAIGIAEDHCAAAQRWWCEERHSQIGQWHRKIDHELHSRKMPVIHNAFGFRRVYVGGAPYGRTQGNLLGQALGWICQSTVAIAINKAIERIDCNLDLIGRRRCGTCLVCCGAPIELLLQIHDSALVQVRRQHLDDDLVASLREAMDIKVPYDDPLHIPVEIKWSAENWGRMQKWKRNQ